MRLMLLTMLALSCGASARAESLPSYLDGNETDNRLPTANLPVAAYRPGEPFVQVVTPDILRQQPLAMDTRVQVRKVRFEGGTVYALGELRDHYQPIIGQTLSLAELNELTQRLTRRYQQDGYLLSYAYLPPQDFADGRVHVVLVEGHVHDYRIEGQIGPARAYLVRLLERLKTERPLTRQTLDRSVSLMGRIPGVTLQARVEAPVADDGAARLVVQVSHRPFAGNVTVNDGSRAAPQALVSVASNAQTRYAEQLRASVLAPPGEDEAHFARLDYSQFIDEQGLQLQLSASRYRSEPRTHVRLDDGTDLRQHRDSDRYAIGLNHPLIAAPDEWLEVVGRFYVVKDRVDYQGAAQQADTATDVRALSFEGDWRKVEAGRLRMLSAGVYQGMDYLGASSNAGYDLDFLRLRLSGLQSDDFTDHWQGVASAAAYWSGDSLPDSERVLLGGQGFGRGYPRDQASGDMGWGVAYEVNYSFRRGGEWLKVVQPYAVVDAARTWFNEVDVHEAKLASAALGVRLGDRRYFNVAVELAKPLADVALDSLDRRPRVTLSFSCQL
ncbi:ShlB/FhaC/HecB family hemolysin secretion/activation protein [Pseudomonas entomophila]|uniref:ShlB/FhaC/HecB family hemolysin secretion/activation protein n=1 Tax=Pseudomonas entomophila TaxID=312306 RepID=UPI00200C2FA1|nr:POTRA domain-containing protein [Pseudomonas entomophila]